MKIWRLKQDGEIKLEYVIGVENTSI